MVFSHAPEACQVIDHSKNVGYPSDDCCAPGSKPGMEILKSFMPLPIEITRIFFFPYPYRCVCPAFSVHRDVRRSRWCVANVRKLTFSLPDCGLYLMRASDWE